jgi:hypothetical protein
MQRLRIVLDQKIDGGAVLEGYKVLAADGWMVTQVDQVVNRVAVEGEKLHV